MYNVRVLIGNDDDNDDDVSVFVDIAVHFYLLIL
jgi:hypothetical protein